MLNGKAIGEQVVLQLRDAFESVKEYIGREFAHARHELEKQIKALPPAEKGESGDKGDKGDKGEDGAMGTPGESIVGPQGDRGPPGDKGEPGESGPAGPPGESLPGPPGPPGRDGEKGLDGALGERGQDGFAGKDGASVTLEDVRPMFEAELAKWALEFERRATDLIQRCIDRIEKPKDGAPGKDGRDALDLENFELALSEDERTLTLALVRGETRVEKSVELHYPLYREVYKEGAHYRRGDTVTYGGSVWSALRNTDSKPETDDSWRLSVKRGRDGKDGAAGPRGPEGRKGKDAGRLNGPGPY